MLNKINKRGAVELSIGTIVIIVLAMSMLILGLVLIRGIFSGATSSVDDLNDKVKEEINKLFSDDNKRAVLKLTENTAEVEQGDDFGIAFGVRNIDRGTTSSQTFQYVTQLDDPNIRQNCGVSKEEAEKWVPFGSGSMAIAPGNIESRIVKVIIPESAPVCPTQYRIIIFRPNKGETISSPYADLYFFVDIQPKGLF